MIDLESGKFSMRNRIRKALFSFSFVIMLLIGWIFVHDMICNTYIKCKHDADDLNEVSFEYFKINDQKNELSKFSNETGKYQILSDKADIFNRYFIKIKIYDNSLKDSITYKWNRLSVVRTFGTVCGVN